MKRTTVDLARRAMALVAVVGGVAAAGSLNAQDLTVYGTAGVDGNSTNIQLVGGTMRIGGLGLAPEVGLQGYRLGYDAGTENHTVWAITPSAGASFRMPMGQVGARVGYSFQSDDNGGAPVLEGAGGGSGAVIQAQGNYWGPGPELQGIVSYNFGPEYIWTQAQATVPVLPLPPGRLNAGAEVVWEGRTSGGGGHAFEVGPVVKFSSGHNWSVNAGAGGKFYSGDTTRDNTWYAHVGAVKYGIRLF